MQTTQYAYWREDKPKQPGYSYELISNQFKDFQTPENGLDDLNTWPGAGIDTLVKALEKNAKRIPQHPMMGTKHPTGNADVPWEYKWDTVSTVVETGKHLAAGMLSLGLLPDIDGEGKKWRFLGIQSKNRREWFLLHLANMWAGATTVALYDTLGQDAMRYVID